jgi:hypothetical protein
MVESESGERTSHLTLNPKPLKQATISDLEILQGRQCIADFIVIHNLMISNKSAWQLAGTRQRDTEIG